MHTTQTDPLSHTHTFEKHTDVHNYYKKGETNVCFSALHFTSSVHTDWQWQNEQCFWQNLNITALSMKLVADLLFQQ